MRATGLLALALGLIYAGSICAQTGWYRLKGPGGVFTVEVPSQPGYRTENATSGGGTPFIYHSYTLDHEGRAFVVQTATYPRDVEVSDPRVNLQSALNASEAHLATKKWDKISWMQVHGSPAAEALGVMNDTLHFRNVLILKGRQMYSLGYAGPPGTVRSEDANRFFGSFRIP